MMVVLFACILLGGEGLLVWKVAMAQYADYSCLVFMCM